MQPRFFYEGDVAECARWLPFAKKKFDTYAQLGVIRKNLTPESGVEIRLVMIGMGAVHIKAGNPSGFIFDDINSIETNLFCWTQKNGFGKIKSSKFKGSLNYWHGKNKTVSWGLDVIFSQGHEPVYINGKAYELFPLFSQIRYAFISKGHLVCVARVPEQGTGNQYLGIYFFKLSKLIEFKVGDSYLKNAPALVFSNPYAFGQQATYGGGSFCLANRAGTTLYVGALVYYSYGTAPPPPYDLGTNVYNGNETHSNGLYIFTRCGLEYGYGLDALYIQGFINNAVPGDNFRYEVLTYFYTDIIIDNGECSIDVTSEEIYNQPIFKIATTMSVGENGVSSSSESSKVYDAGDGKTGFYLKEDDTIGIDTVTVDYDFLSVSTAGGGGQYTFNESVSLTVTQTVKGVSYTSTFNGSKTGSHHNGSQTITISAEKNGISFTGNNVYIDDLTVASETASGNSGSEVITTSVVDQIVADANAVLAEGYVNIAKQGYPGNGSPVRLTVEVDANETTFTLNGSVSQILAPSVSLDSEDENYWENVLPIYFIVWSNYSGEVVSLVDVVSETSITVTRGQKNTTATQLLIDSFINRYTTPDVTRNLVLDSLFDNHRGHAFYGQFPVYTAPGLGTTPTNFPFVNGFPTTGAEAGSSTVETVSAKKIFQDSTNEKGYTVNNSPYGKWYGFPFEGLPMVNTNLTDLEGTNDNPGQFVSATTGFAESVNSFFFVPYHLILGASSDNLITIECDRHKNALYFKKNLVSNVTEIKAVKADFTLDDAQAELEQFVDNYEILKGVV